ncbi:hypothetical protein J4206_03115 [Candidatus Woesearchaeota archaeon]|nr:hypothetical protein [Candidatus Woesearchaeota archaeon]
MGDRKKTLVLFDVGAVELELDYSRFYQEAAKISTRYKNDPDAFKDAFVASNLENRLMVRELTAAEYLMQLRNLILPGIELSDQGLMDINSCCWPRQVEKVVALKRKIHDAGYSVGIFSNMTELALGILSARFPEVFETYDPASPKIYSFETGSTKSEDKMYERIRGYGKVILIDDNAAYVARAVERFGWKGILFTPYIDRAEAIRAKEHTGAMHSENLKMVNSEDGLAGALRAFGVDVK